MRTVKERENVSKDLLECVEKAGGYATVIKRAGVSGKTCRKQAIWIGLDR